ncbi:D-alanyl-D-alanine carboxypeptidase family protein [Streptomyces pristinaespiralis]|uniref:D-alanyl-D-alanine carboxypeptidase family protein n=1 Tax=Streptomyces pristinaespiralis TaxID=38300 RepID=UPI00340460F0
MIIRFTARLAFCCATAVAATAFGLLAAPAAQAEPTPRPASADASLLQRPGTHVGPLNGAPDLPEDVSALSWLVADADTGDVLAAHDAHRRLPPASTIKTLFALTALPHLADAPPHKVTEEELAGVGEGSSLVGIAPGRTYTMDDLWRGVFLSSGNDAVRVLAEMNGGWAATAEQMQAKARALGAFDTHVVSPDGYDEPGQVSSAFDLAVFGRAGLTDPQFASYASTVDAPFPGGTHDDGTPTWTYGIRNTNRLLTGADGVEPYPGIIGVKNGYTSNAGNTLVAAARRDGRTLVVTVLNPQSGGGHKVYEEARSLLDWGFLAADRVEPVGSLEPQVAEKAPPAGPGPVTPAGPGPVTPAAAPPARAAAHSAETGTGMAYAWVGAFVGASGLASVLILRQRGRHRPPGTGS